MVEGLDRDLGVSNACSNDVLKRNMRGKRLLNMSERLMTEVGWWVLDNRYAYF